MEWISINERLPIVSVPVLVWLCGEGHAGYCGIAALREFGQAFVWHMDYPTGEKGNSWLITHWVSLGDGPL